MAAFAGLGPAAVTNGASPRWPGLKSAGDPADSEYMDPSAIALQGLQQAEAQVETAAAAIAGAASANGSNPDVVDISAEIIALISAQASSAANVATLDTVDQMQQNLLDITA